MSDPTDGPGGPGNADTASRAASFPADYAIRPYEPGDDADVVALHNRVWNGDRSVAWFRWKYVDNPYVDRVPVYVATAGDDVVGAFGLVAFRMRAGDATGIGMLAGDLVVHPDHRRRGVFTRLFGEILGDSPTSGGSIARAPPADDDGPGASTGDGHDRAESAFLFAYANEDSHPGMVGLGWTPVEPRITYHRVQDPRSYVRDRFGAGAARVAGPVVAGLSRATLRVRGRGASAPPDVTVTRVDDVPVATLTGLAAVDPPPGTVQPVYDAAFYEWWFAGGSRTHDDVYVARRDGDPVAVVVTRETRDERLDATTVWLVHAVPLADRGPRDGSAGETDREAGLAAILDRVVADNRGSDFLRAWNPVYPARMLRERGFLADDRPPLSWATGPDLRLVTHSMSGAPFDDAALARSGPALWSLDT